MAKLSGMTAVLSFVSIGTEVPQPVREVVEDLERLQPRLAATMKPEGGYERVRLDSVIRPMILGFGFEPGSAATIAPKELDYTALDRWTALSIQAGRAATNNGALLAVLAAASTRDVDWLVVLVPARYKGGNTYEQVMDQLRDLEASPGVRLELEGAVVIEY